MTGARLLLVGVMSFGALVQADSATIASATRAKDLPQPDYPSSCFGPGLLPTFEESHVPGTAFHDYQSEVPDALNPQQLRAPVRVRVWRHACGPDGSAILVEFTRLAGFPLAPRNGLIQGDLSAPTRLGYEANNFVFDGTGGPIPTFEGTNSQTTFVIGATTDTVEVGIDFQDEIDVVIEHPRFDAILRLPAYDTIDYGVTEFQPINGRYTGSYFNLARQGEGIFVEIIREDDGSRGLLISFFTFREGEQMWLVGSVDIGENQRRVEVPVVRARGTGFGANFSPADVETENWGTLTLRFRSCSSVVMNYDGIDGAGQLLMSRLTTIDGYDCR